MLLGAFTRSLFDFFGMDWIWSPFECLVLEGTNMSESKASTPLHRQSTIPKLAEHIAIQFKKALDKQEVVDEKRVTELESVVLNDILQASGWKVEAEWEWSQPGHINVLESRSLIALHRSLILEGGDLSFPALLDSRVAKGTIFGTSATTIFASRLCLHFGRELASLLWVLHRPG